jgi:8-oxo-dGTP diphosphatase
MYQNSKPSVCGIIIQDGLVLLVKDNESSQEWDLPGGFLQLGESPEQGLVREIKEELQADICILNIINAKTDVYGNCGEFSLNLFYEVTLLSNKLVPNGEITQFRWFNIMELPKLKYKSTKQGIEEFISSSLYRQKNSD